MALSYFIKLLNELSEDNQPEWGAMSPQKQDGQPKGHSLAKGTRPLKQAAREDGWRRYKRDHGLTRGAPINQLEHNHSI